MSNRKKEKVVVLSAEGVVKLVFFWAYDDEESTPQVMDTLNAGLKLAESRGFTESGKLRGAFAAPDAKVERATFLERLYAYVSAEEFLSASGAYQKLFGTTH